MHFTKVLNATSLSFTYFFMEISSHKKCFTWFGKKFRLEQRVRNCNRTEALKSCNISFDSIFNSTVCTEWPLTLKFSEPWSDL
jgi:hypothetical protein